MVGGTPRGGPGGRAFVLLARSVAHDLGNLLMIVGGHAELLASGSTPAGPHLDAIRSAAASAASLVERLKAFEEHPCAAPSASVEVVARRVERLLRPILSPSHDLVVTTEAGLGLVAIEALGLERALVNLVANARDALPEGGAVRVVAEPAAGRPPGWVRVAVVDDGVGMAEEVLARATEPLFTTKAASGGTGLGLTTARDLVTAAGGEVDVRSAPGQGTTVELLLPPAGDAAP